MNDNTVFLKSKDFAVRIVNLYKYLAYSKNEYIMSKQLLRAGTSIGANISEAIRAFSKADFIFKMNISLKECCETEYWLDILHSTDYINDLEYDSIKSDCIEIIKLLTAIVKNSKETL